MTRKIPWFNGFAFALFVVLYTYNALPAVSVKVFMEDKTLSDTARAYPLVYVKNTGTDTLKNFYFYYYFTTEQGNAAAYDAFYSPNTTVTLEKLDSTNYRLKFLVSDWPLKPNDSLFDEQFAIHYDYTQKVDKSNDYSYMANATFLENKNIPVFLVAHDSLIYGIPPIKPTAKFSGSPRTGQDSLKVQFTDSSTGAITSRLWDFGDNSTDTSANPLHDYTKPGKFSVKLVVIGSGGKDSVALKDYIVISVAKPVAKLSGAPLLGTDSLKVQFIDSSTGAITSRLWDFGDNSTDTSANPLHDYTKPGKFSVKLVVIGSGGKDSVTLKDYIVISVAKPVAKLSGAPLLGTDSLKVQFIDSSTGAITSRLWDFGDNSTDTSASPLHDYTKPGKFSVKLVVIGPSGKDSVTLSNYISITPTLAKPELKFSGAPTFGYDSLKVQFIDSSTGGISSRLWDFGDNSTDTSASPAHNYTKPGKFTVKLVVIGPGGKDSVSILNYIIIKATPAKPIAKFSGAPTFGYDSLKVQFIDSSTGGISSRLWDFGDNSTDTSASPVHNYTKIGKFIVKLVVIGQSGKDSVTLVNYIVITASATPPDTGDTGIVINTIQIKKIVFDSLANAIKVFWTKDSAQSLNYSIGISFSAAGPPADANTAKVVSGNLRSDSATISLGASVLFDTTYHVALWLKRGNGPWSTPIRTSVAVSSFTWQEIVYFGANGVADTSYAYNKRIRLCNDVAGDPIKDTLIAWSPLDAAANGFVPVSVGFYFKHQNPSPIFSIGLRCDSIPKRLTADNVRIYRYDKGAWLVEANSAYDPSSGFVSVKTRDLQKPFIAMIDTVKPSYMHRGNFGPMPAGQPIVDTFIISDNVSNMKCAFRFTKGENSFGEGDSIDTVVSLKNDTIVNTIPGSTVSEDNGVRALFIISDGVHTDTMNLSRQTIRARSSDAFTTGEMQWMQLHTTALPETSDIRYALRNFAVKGKWAYNPTAFRLFRWYPSEQNAQKSDKYVEYSDSIRNLFSMTPGNILWLKSRKQVLVDFGRATTPSLIQPYEIVAQPGEWTDIALPFKFDIFIGDILASTNGGGSPADSLEWYRWTPDTTSNYFAAPAYVPGLGDVFPQLANGSYEMASSETAGYTVRNTSHAAIRILFPPLPVAMSVFAQPLVKKSSPGNWALTINGKTAAGKALSPVYCGCVAGPRKAPSFFSAPPCMEGVAIRICDSSQNQFGHQLIYAARGEAGATFDLTFVNNSQASETIDYSVKNLDQLPKGLRCLALDPKTGDAEPPDKSLKVTVAALSCAHRTLAIGNTEYLAKIKDNARVWKLALLGAFPNPCGKFLRIRYSLPETGIDRIKLSIVSVFGRQVYEMMQRCAHTMCVREAVWDGSVGRNTIAAGVYVVRLTAFDEKSREAGVFEKKITFLP
jgi:PKD repeat protein